MDSEEGSSSNKVPLFDGSNYAFWNIRMEAYLSSLGFDVWIFVINGHTIPATPPTDHDRKKALEKNAKEKNAIHCGFLNS